MRYAVEITGAARKALASAPSRDRRRIAASIDALADDPRPRGSKKLLGEEGLWRIRVGDYRVIYSINGRKLVVLVVRVGHRREVYR